MSRIAETNLELNNGTEYNNLCVSVYRNNDNSLSVTMNPEKVEVKDGYSMVSFTMFGNGRKQIRVPYAVINRLTTKAKTTVRTILENNKDNLMDLFNEVTETNAYPTRNTKLLNELAKAFTK